MLDLGLVSISHGVIVDQPWIGKILRGEKIWEMRSTGVKRRGPIALIQKGTGCVVGVANLVDVKGPFTNDELQNHEHIHHVPPAMYRAPDYKWRIAWVLADVTTLQEPVPYKHKNGAVTWVELDQGARDQISLQLDRPTSELDLAEARPSVGEKAVHASKIIDHSPASLKGTSFDDEYGEPSIIGQVPIARNGTVFCPQACLRGGNYTVGEKGDEKQFPDYQAALSYLQKMSVAKWRRPNPAGNWGIVQAVEWIDSV
jgi:ASCH domain-containing protein